MALLTKWALTFRPSKPVSQKHIDYLERPSKFPPKCKIPSISHSYDASVFVGITTIFTERIRLPAVAE
jgi:hypothetical protein